MTWTAADFEAALVTETSTAFQHTQLCDYVMLQFCQRLSDVSQHTDNNVRHEASTLSLPGSRSSSDFAAPAFRAPFLTALLQ